MATDVYPSKSLIKWTKSVRNTEKSARNANRVSFANNKQGFQVIFGLNFNAAVEKRCNEQRILDFTGHGLKKIDLPPGESPITLILDRNNLTKIENLEQCQKLKQLSVAANHLVRLTGLSKLHYLTVLNLPNNNICHIEGLKELCWLSWLNLSGNSIKVIENLEGVYNLQHLDLSDNTVVSINDISHLKQLNTLLLHGNLITSLSPAEKHLPKSLTILSLAENDIVDLNEVSYLTFLCNLEQLSVMNNPCVTMTDITPDFDYRPFILNWCNNLKVLDGYLCSDKERLRAEWLYSQGKGRHFKPGSHIQLVQYLANVCPKAPVAKVETEEDAHLSRILNKQKLYQQQLSEDFHQSVSNSISQNNTLNSRVSQETTAASLEPPNTNQYAPSMEANISFQSPYERNPLRAWTQGRPSTQMNAARQGIHRSDVYVQDITSQDLDSSSNASSGDLLVSESVYIPVDEKTPRPTTAPEIRPSSPPSHTEFSTPHNVRPSTAMANNRDKPNSKYEAYDKRPVKPLNQELAKGIMKPTFNISSPQRSPNEPSQGNKRMATPPIAQAQDYDTSQELNHSDQENISMDEPTQNELTLIKDKIGARRARSFTKGTKEVKKNIKNASKTENVLYNKSGIPIRSGVQSKIDTGIKRNRSLQQTLSELSKCKSKKTDSQKDQRLSNTQDSGFLSRPASDAILADYSEDEHRAATSIQAFWRGYWARQYNRDVVSVRKEIRARRAEDHILVLKAELERQRKMYEQERQLRNLQLEAIRYLWREVQSLQSWKSEVLCSPSLKITDTNKHVDNSNYNDKLQSTLEKMDTLTNKPDNSLPTQDFERQQELEKTCSTLQSQVSHLQESLHSLSSYIFNSESFQTDFHHTVQESPIDVLGSFDEEFEKSNMDHAIWGSVPHSLSPYPSEEEEMYFQRVPHPGCPTPPRGLKIQHSNGHSVILKWKSSKILDANGREIKKPLLGYRIHVNEQPKSLIDPSKNKALVIGLNSRLTYKFYVKAVAPLGESFESNIVMAALGKGQDKTHDCSSSDIDQTDDSEKDHDSTETHDRRKLKKESRHKRSRKVRSPRLEKNKSKEEVLGNNQDFHYNENSDDSRPPTAKSDIQRNSGIITQPKLHTHRRSHSKDYHDKLPDCQMMSSSEMVTQSTASTLPTKETVVRFSDTLTLDSQSSILSIIGAKLPEVTTQKPPTPESEFIKTHRRNRSKELKVEGEFVYDSSALKQVEYDTKDIEKSPVNYTIEKKGKDFIIPDSPHKEGKLHGHKRKKSKDLQSYEQGSNIDSKEQDVNSKSVPIIDGRRRHVSGGRPDSPKVLESEDRTKVSTPEKRRQPVADILEQRFSSSLKSSAQVSDKPVNANNSGESETLRSERTASVENVDIPEDNSGNKSSNSSPTYTVRHRTRSVGSDSDIHSSTCRAIKDFDQKSSSTTTHVVANLLKKLQSFTKSQKETIEEKSKLRKKSSEQQSSLSRESTFMSDDEKAARRRVSGSDSEAVYSESSALHSDSSSGGHSDDNRSGRHRSHRRTPSDHKLSNIGKDLSFSGSGHSPIIMEGGSLKKQPATSSVKRTASFNGATLPSRKHDINKKGMSGSEENLAEKPVKSAVNDEDSSEVSSVRSSPTKDTSLRSPKPPLSVNEFIKHFKLPDTLTKKVDANLRDLPRPPKRSFKESSKLTGIRRSRSFMELSRSRTPQKHVERERPQTSIDFYDSVLNSALDVPSSTPTLDSSHVTSSISVKERIKLLETSHDELSS